MNNTKKGFIWIDWISWTCFILYLLLAYTSSDRFNLLLGRSGLFTSCILIILFFNHIDVIQALKNKEKELILCLFVGILAFINMYLAKSGPAVIFDIANFFLILYLSDKIELDDISLCIITSGFFLIFLFWTKFGDENYNYNTISLIVLESATLSALGFSYFLSKWEKEWIIYFYLLITFIAVVWPTAEKYEGRTELGAILILFFLFFFVPKIIWQFKKLYCFFVGSTIAASLIVPIKFMHIYYGYINQGLEVPTEVRILHGREPVWMQYLEAWKKEPWTGIGNDYIGKIPDLRFSSVHNGLYHLLVVYGIPIFFITLIFFGYKIAKIKTQQVSLTKKLGLSVIIAMIAISAMESYIIVSFSNMILFFVLLIVFKDKDKI